MGVDSEGSGGKGVVGEVGTIVWVRRRNGSWWPGRILGHHELSASHLMSPRSGTPVKLLGREDASVDWYNLEKSKRVKAFRCGEFDACIERAEASQGVPIKKREKYARREDAILHAHELEKQMLEGRRQGSGCSFSDIHSGPLKNERYMGYHTENAISISDNSAHRKLLNYRNMDLAFTEATNGKSFSEKWKDDMHDRSKDSFFTGYASDLLRTRQSYSDHHDLLEKENTPIGVIEPYESDVLERLHSASDTEDDETLIPSTSQSFLSEFVGYRRSDEYDHWGCTTQGSLLSLNKDLTVLSGRRMNSLIETGVSRWNLKGKRNIRKASNRAVKPADVNIDHKVSYEDKKYIHNISRGATGYMDSDSQTDDSVDSDLIDKDTDSEFSPTGEGTYPLVFQENSLDSAYNSMNDSDRDSCEMSRFCWDTEKQFHAAQSSQWDRLPRQFGYFYASKYRDRIDSGLVDVDLKVQASYQGKRVPLVSLTSKLDGKAIISHSLEVETLGDGFTDTLLQDLDYGGSPFSDGNGTSPVRRTRRRSALLRSQAGGRVFEWSRHTKKGSHSPRPAKKLQKKCSKQLSTSDVKPRSPSSLAKWQRSDTAHNKIGKPSSKA